MTTAATDAALRLHAVTRETDGPADVLDALGADGVVWLHDGAEFATAGIAARRSEERRVGKECRL